MLLFALERSAVAQSETKQLWSVGEASKTSDCVPIVPTEALNLRCAIINRSAFSDLRDQFLAPGAPPQYAILPLPGADAIEIIVDRVSQRSVDSYSLFGREVGKPVNRVLLVFEKGQIVGVLSLLSGTYRLRPTNSGRHVIYLVNDTVLPMDAGDAISPPDSSVYLRDDQFDFMPKNAGAASTSVNVLIVYTPAARESIGISSLNTFFQSWEDYINQAFINGGYLDVDIHIVGSEEVNYSQDADSLQFDLFRLSGPSDGYMDEVHQWREDYGADLVHLVVNTSTSGCGVAYLINPSSADNGGFGVTAQSCAEYVFAHEIGHNLGMHHDSYVVPPNESSYWEYGHGYVNVDPVFRFKTIMAYPDHCSDLGISCPRINYYSDLDHTAGGQPLGIPPSPGSRSADNIRVLEEMAPIIADFRFSPSNAAPVASFSAVPVSGAVPLNVAFDASSSSDPDGDALTYAWDLGDGTFGSGLTLNHTFQTPGAYLVVLTVSDGTLSDLSTKTLTVTAPVLKPDLVIEDVTFTPSSVVAGETIALNYRVRNQGTGDAGASVARMWLSLDQTLTSGDPGLSPLEYASGEVHLAWVCE